jgi:hypothetical protein
MSSQGLTRQKLANVSLNISSIHTFNHLGLATAQYRRNKELNTNSRPEIRNQLFGPICEDRCDNQTNLKLQVTRVQCTNNLDTYQPFRVYCFPQGSTQHNSANDSFNINSSHSFNPTFSSCNCRM